MARPLVWIGAYSPGALTLPPADPTPSHLYAPRGVYLDEQMLIVADSGNHRVLIWHNIPDCDGQPADVALGQPDFFSEGPQSAGRGPRYGMYLPTGVIVVEQRLYVADSWNHRILVWNRIPEATNTPPDRVIGQADLDGCEPNRGGAVTGRGFYWPYGIGWVAGRFYVADTGNRRVLGWNSVPEDRQPPDLVLGQNDTSSTTPKIAATRRRRIRFAGPTRLPVTIRPCTSPMRVIIGCLAGRRFPIEIPRHVWSSGSAICIAPAKYRICRREHRHSGFPTQLHAPHGA